MLSYGFQIVGAFSSFETSSQALEISVSVFPMMPPFPETPDFSSHVPPANLPDPAQFPGLSPASSALGDLSVIWA